MSGELNLKEIQNKWHGSIKSYAIGFTASLLLTVASFFLVIMKVLPGKLLIFTILGLALTQAIFQLLYFLHLGKEGHPRWETLVFFFMVMVLLIVSLCSIWIMTDLNARMMTDMNMEK
jgi:cytochrome o ubiquinol oxidase operon protein cyoD